MRAWLSATLQHGRRPPFALGILVAAWCVAAETLLASPLKQMVSGYSLDVLYLPGILVVSSVWGLWLGMATAVASTVAFDYFLTPPAGSLTLLAGEDWAVLVGLVAAALMAWLIIKLARSLIANADSRAELQASRARVVAAADATRRSIERDLHDRTQQRLVSVMLELRAMETTPPTHPEELRQTLCHTTHALDEALEDLRGIARDLHPALLSRRGLEPAIKALARRSAVPVELNMRADRLAARLEAAAYYVVSEALTNVAEHAGASVVHVDLIVNDAAIRLSIRDDGKGGADPHRGSGLFSITDRVEALGGRTEIVSPPGGGTSIFAEIPIDDG